MKVKVVYRGWWFSDRVITGVSAVVQITSVVGNLARRGLFSVLESSVVCVLEILEGIIGRPRSVTRLIKPGPGNLIT